MHKPKHLPVILVACALSALAVIFGSYLVQQKIVLPLQTGQTLERYGLVERASEPWTFWFSIFLFGSIGIGIVIAGLAYPVSMLLSRFRKNSRDP